MRYARSNEGNDKNNFTQLEKATIRQINATLVEAGIISFLALILPKLLLGTNSADLWPAVRFGAPMATVILFSGLSIAKGIGK